MLPEKPEFEFLRKNNFRIKTMKMAGVISQGICFPLSILPEKKNEEYELNCDVTSKMGIKQYEKTMDKETFSSNKKRKYPRFLMRMRWFRKLVTKDKSKSEFPSFLRKTDEVRIQNIPYILNDKRKFIATEKIDGQSGTFCLVRKKRLLPFLPDKFEYMVCSRNYRLKRKDNSSYWRVSEKYKIEEVLKKLIGGRDWVALQGECIAPKVQGNKYNVSDADFYAFNLIYPNLFTKSSYRINSVEARNICSNLGIKFVPIIDTEYILPDTVNEVLEFAHGKSQIGDTLREGIVFRSQDGAISFKAVDPKYLIKYDE